MKKLLLAAAFLVTGTVSAFAQQGAFPNYPTVGVPADTQCLSFANNGRCSQFRPAGPNQLPDTATIPADTNLTGGQPQTVRVPAVLTGATVTNNVPVTGFSVAALPGTAKLILNPAGTLATGTITLPAASALTDGQTLSIYSTQTVTTLTLTPGTGTTINAAPTTVTAAAPVKLVYIAALARWQAQ